VATAPNDDELIEGCLRNDEGAWRELIVRYRRLIYSIPVAYRLPDPDEIFQIVAVKLLENLATLKNRASLGAWIATTTRRECISVRKKEQRSVSLDDQPPEELSEEAPDIAQRLLDIECEHMLHVALERLDEICKALLHAFYLEDPTPSYKEVAQRINRPVGSLGPTRGRCLTKLQEHYVDLGGESPHGVSDASDDAP
jgi:RNA polymerase sigma factor (sigma-70 family)